MVSVSGVRGIVGKDLTPEVVAKWAAGFGKWAKGVVVLGRDSRESGPLFAKAAAAALVAAGCDVIDCGLVPTPTVQLAVEHHHAAGGIVITASHNPVEWNALKFVGPDGIFLDADAGARVRHLAEAQQAAKAKAGKARKDGNAIKRHLNAVLKLRGVDLAAIRGRALTVALDTCRGAGGTIIPTLLERLGCRVVAINLETDGRFPRPPEPVAENLGDLSELVRKSGADLGIAIDPDVDRLALVDETGTPIGEDYTLAFAIRAVLGSGRSVGPSGRRSVVVCNLSTSLVVEDAAKDCGATVIRTPVGEAHVARAMRSHRAAIGGEGNGGVIDPRLHLGRDAPLAATLALQFLVAGGKSLSEQVRSAPRYTIVKKKAPRGDMALAALYTAIQSALPDGAPDTRDGLRLAWSDRWVHIRPSGTEPVVRVIAEAKTKDEAQSLVETCLHLLP
jgi:phosphomannomutase